MLRTSANPFYAARQSRRATANPPDLRKLVIGTATLYCGDCFEVLPTLSDIGAVVTDPPFCIGFSYRSYDDAPHKYHDLMRRLVPECTRITDGGPCFVWQSPLTAGRWHRYFPDGYRIIAACKIYPKHLGKSPSMSWDPVIFWSRRRRVRDELPRDWHVADLRPWDGYRGDNIHPCPRPLTQVRYFCDATSADVILDPFMGSGTTGVAAILAGKRFVGHEQDPVYFDYTCERIAKAVTDRQEADMEISKPNQWGVVKAGHEEIVARHGLRCYAAVHIALCEDGLYRQSTSMMHSYGGHSGPVFMSTPGFNTVAAAIDAGIEELLHQWHTPFPFKPQSSRNELDDLRQQIEARLKQPSLF